MVALYHILSELGVPQGDPTYIIVKDGGIEDFGVNAVCTHLGCVVPWVAVSLGPGIDCWGVI